MMRAIKPCYKSIFIMKRNRLWVVTIFLFFLMVITSVQAQKGQKTQKTQKTQTQKKQATKTAVSKPPAKPADPGKAGGEPEKHEAKVRDMVTFLEYVLNTLGSRQTSSRDKDVLVTQSYTKIFRDAKVQVEDDLDEGRKVITNKDVQAYLKDVDFFFDDAVFKLDVEDIHGEVTAGNTLFYKVSVRRKLQGTTAEGQRVNTSIRRYIEINYLPEDQDLKIVSMYTHEFNQKDALLTWWKQLSYEWQSVFKRQMNIADSVGLDNIKDMMALDALDLSRNNYIQTIEPLASLVNLRTLNLAYTPITDLTPIRNLSELTDLDLSYTKVQDLSVLKYCDKLARFKINATPIQDITVLQEMPALEHLELRQTNVSDFSALSSLTSLKHIDLEGTRIASLDPLKGSTQLTELNASRTGIGNLNGVAELKLLEVLEIDSTGITDVNALSSLENLQVLSLNYTLVGELQPLQNLRKLERVYSDHSRVNRAAAEAYMTAHPAVLVITDSEDLKSWWDGLPPAWQNILREASKVSVKPTKEELAVMTTLDSVDLAGHPDVRDLEPLRMLRKLAVINVSGTGVRDLQPLKDHRDIRVLDISNTAVSDLSVAHRFTNLEILRADNTRIGAIQPLYGLSGLKQLYIDQTTTAESDVQGLLKENGACLVVFKTDTLKYWWTALPDAWRKVLQTQVPVGDRPTREELHRLAELEKVHFSEAAISSLEPLQVFVRLRELYFSETRITDVTPLAGLTTLTSLHATRSPIHKFGPIGKLTALEDLDISNTLIEDTEVWGKLENLKKLNCSGTPVKSLDALEKLTMLEYVDCSNTPVKSLTPLEALPLKTLKCYNTKVSDKRVESFRKLKPECNVVYYR